MSVTAVGPALDINGSLPVAPPYSLLSIPGVLLSDGDRWMNGVKMYGYPEETPFTWEPCATGTFRAKEDGSAPPQPRFDAFGMYVPITCSAGYMGDWQDFAGRAEAVLEAAQSFGVEEALSQGVSMSLNPFLGDANLTVLGGGAVAPTVGLAYLEEAIGATGRMGLIHATPAAVASWGFNLLETGDALRTVNGTPVASGGGYIGSAPVGEAAAAAGQSWAFATGPVQVRLSEVQLVGDDINGTLDTSNNDVTFRAEKYALAVWDGALQAGVLIDWSP